MSGEALPLTRSEVWSVDPKRFDMLSHAMDEQGARMMELDNSYTELLKPATNAASDQMKARMKSIGGKAFTSATMMRAPPPEFVEYAIGRGTKPMLADKRPRQADSTEIRIPISQTRSIVARRVYVETTRDGCVWNGQIEGTNMPVNLMWWPGGRMTGTFTHKGRTYVIRNMGGDEHAVIELDPEKLPDEHPAASDRPAMPENLRNLQDARSPEAYLPEALARHLKSTDERTKTDKASASDKAVIRVLFAYTKRAARNYGDIRRDLLVLAVEQTNQSFRSSKLEGIRAEIADAVEVGYDDSTGNHFNHLWRMVDRGNRHLDAVHALRDKAKADIVILIVDSDTGCGLATRVGAFADEAFAVVHHECATTTYSVAHEIGHLIGARHDRALDKSTRPFPYGHGFVNASSWRTMMSYRSSCNGCPRLPIWSSPSVDIDGIIAGNDNTNNARVIQEQAERVSRFR